MAISAYKSSTTRRIFTNYPFKRGMLYDDLMITENASRAIVNLDIPSAGDYAQPRPAFVNAAIDTFYKVALTFPVNVIKQTTSLAKTFIIGFDNMVNEENYINDVVITNESVNTKNYGVTILENEFAFEERERRDGIYKVEEITDVIDGDTYGLTYRNEDNNVVPTFGSVRLRLLGIDTPEIFPTTEPFADAALQFALELIRPTHETRDNIAGYEIEDYYIQFEPATVSTDRTDDSRLLAYLLVELKNTETDETEIYTITELLLKAGLGVLQADPDYIYYDRLKQAYDYAIENELGIHPLEVEEEVFDGNLDWDTLSDPVIDPTAPEDTVDIFYDSQNGNYYTEFEITNDTGEDVILIVEVGSNTFQETVDDGEIKTFNYSLFTDVDYKIRARFFPQNQQQELNASSWTELELGRVSLNIDANVLENTQFEITEENGNSIDYIITNNLDFRLYIRAKHDEDTLFAKFFVPNEVETGTYTNSDWDKFSTDTKFITVYYETPAELGAIKSYTTLVGYEIGGELPVISGASADQLDISFDITNNNDFEVDAYFEYVSINELLSSTPVSLDGGETKNITQEVSFYSTTYTINAYFKDAADPSIQSGTTSENVTTGVQPQNVTATFDSNGGSTSYPPVSGTPPLTINYPGSTSKTGYDFTGWDNGLGTSGSVVISSDTTFTAQFTIKSYTITWKPNGGEWNDGSTSDKTRTVNHFTTPGPPESISRNNYSFNRWDPNITSATGNATYTAIWDLVSEPEDVTATFDSNGSGTNPSSQTGPEPYEVDDPGNRSKTGYDFDGWAVDGSIVSFPYEISEDTSFVASFTAKTYTVSFNKNGGNNPSFFSKEVTYDSTYGTLPTITRSGDYDFKGWYTSSSGGTKITSNTTVKITSNDTLYAQWEDTSTTEYGLLVQAFPDPYPSDTIFITFNGEEIAGYQQDTEAGTSITVGASATAIADGNTYIFIAWRTESGSTVTTNTTYSFTLNSNTTLYAHYEKEAEPDPVETVEFSVRVAGASLSAVSIGVNGVSESVTASGTVVATKDEGTSESISLSATSVFILGGTTYTFVRWRTEYGSTLSTNTNYTYNWGSSTDDTQIVVEYEIGSQFV